MTLPSVGVATAQLARLIQAHRRPVMMSQTGADHNREQSYSGSGSAGPAASIIINDSRVFIQSDPRDDVNKNWGWKQLGGGDICLTSKTFLLITCRSSILIKSRPEI